MQDEHFWACVRRISSILGGLTIPYHFAGGLASFFLRLQTLRLGLANELSRIEEAAASGQNAEDLDLNF